MLEILGVEPSFWGKLSNIYWVYPSAWRLRRLTTDGTDHHIERGNGEIHELHAGEYEAKFTMDQYKRRLIIIKYAKGKVKIFEGMQKLEGGDFDQVIALIGARETRVSKVSRKLTKVMNLVQEEVENIGR